MTDEKMWAALEPCPRCHNNAPFLRKSRDGDAEWVQCAECGHSGKVCLTEADARAAWNDARQALASAPVDQDEDDPCPNGSHCCCCGPGEPCCDCGKIMPATGDGAEDVVERLMDEAYQSADCPAGGPYALSWEQAKYMVRAALTSTTVVPGMVATIRGQRGCKIDSVAELMRLINGGAKVEAIEFAVPTPEGE